ncbi:MAG TPA: hypothetical protein HA306_07930 [Methanosarcina sp.]|nr:hypothetical protein [Methanosarcina sp.]
MRERKTIEKVLDIDEITTYIFVELSCPQEGKKNSTEQGVSKASTEIQSVSAVLMGSSRKGFPSK